MKPPTYANDTARTSGKAPPSHERGPVHGKVAGQARSATTGLKTNSAFEKEPGLADAAFSLAEIAAGRVPSRSRLIAGALALDTLVKRGEFDRDLLDAAQGLSLAATGLALDLDDAGQARVAHLAAVVAARAGLAGRPQP